MGGMGQYGSKKCTWFYALVTNYLVLTGTWRTHIAKEESAWCKVGQDVPMEYAATVSVNPCTALRMLDDFVDLKAGQLR